MKGKFNMQKNQNKEDHQGEFLPEKNMTTIKIRICKELVFEIFPVFPLFLVEYRVNMKGI